GYRAFGFPAGGFDPLIRRGELFAGAAAVRTHPELHGYFKRHRPKPNQCFANCQTFVVFDDAGLATYYEGYSGEPGGVLLFLHAWLVVGGVVFDPTMEAVIRRAERRGGPDHAPLSRRAYFGVPFPRKAVDVQMRTGYHAPLLGSLPGII